MGYHPISYNDYLAKAERINMTITNPEILPTDLEKVASICQQITFQVTEDCNLACTYCYQGHKTKNHMTFDVAKKFIDKLLTADPTFEEVTHSRQMKGVMVEFIGGEPFLEIDLIEQICDYFLEQLVVLKHPWLNYYRFHTTTNGILFFEPKVQRFLHRMKDCFSVTVTVDGCKEIHDKCRIFPDGSPSYDLAIKASKEVAKLYGSEGTKITISPDNLTFLSQSLIETLERGCHEINSNVVYEKGWTYEHGTELFKQLKTFADYFIDKGYVIEDYAIRELGLAEDIYFHPILPSSYHNYCGGVDFMIALDYKGDIYRCIRYMKTSIGDKQEPYIIGNIEEGIGQSSITKQRLQCMNCITRQSQSTEECLHCPIAAGCGWCSGYNYECYGTPNKRATFICPMHKAEALASVYFHNHYAKKHPEYTPKDMWIPKKYALEIISEEEYQELVACTKAVGGYVNEKYEFIPDEIYHTEIEPRISKYLTTKKRESYRLC